MKQQRYSGNVVTRTREYSPEEVQIIPNMLGANARETTLKMERLLRMDNNMVAGASMYMECIWLWGGKTKSGLMKERHQHEFDEIVGLISSNPANPKDLDAVMEMNLGDEVHSLTKSCLIYIPAGMKHSPLTVKEVRRPVFFFTLSPLSSNGWTSGAKTPESNKKSTFIPPNQPDTAGTKYGRYIVTEPKMHVPSGPKPENPPPRPPSNAKTSHLVSLEGDVLPGAPYVDFVWIWSGSLTMSPQSHRHPFDEMIGVVGTATSENSREVNGDVSVCMEGEKYSLTQSSLVYVPSGLDHCPLEFKNIQKPVLCFTIGNTTRWDIAKPA